MDYKNGWGELFKYIAFCFLVLILAFFSFSFYFSIPLPPISPSFILSPALPLFSIYLSTIYLSPPLSLSHIHVSIFNRSIPTHSQTHPKLPSLPHTHSPHTPQNTLPPTHTLPQHTPTPTNTPSLPHTHLSHTTPPPTQTASHKSSRWPKRLSEGRAASPPTLSVAVSFPRQWWRRALSPGP